MERLSSACSLSNMMQEQQHAKANTTAGTPEAPSVAEILQLHQVGILSLTKARDLVEKYYPCEAKSEPVSDAYTTPKRKRSMHGLDVIEAEMEEKIRPNNNFRCPQKPSKTKKRRPNKASPETAKIRRLVKEITRQRFLKQCMDVESPLWKKTHTGQRIMNKILFARAAAKPMASLYQSYPETLHGVPGRKVMNVMQWQVRLNILFEYLV